MARPPAACSTTRCSACVIQSRGGSSLAHPVTIDRCVCRRTLFRDLLPAARASRWTLEDLMHATGCGDQCGLCRPYLRQMLRDGTTVFHTVLAPDESAP